MGQLVLLVVAAAWAAVLVPPLLRSRIENRPNSSVTDFRNQLSSLQRAMPGRGVAMRSMARPLAPSPLSRPAAPGRPALRSGVRTHGSLSAPAPRPAATGRPPAERTRVYDATPRPRAHGDRQAPTVTSRDAVKRRRANVLFVLALVAGCTLFLAATTRVEAMLWAFCGAFAALCGYVYVLGQLRRRDDLAGLGADLPPATRRAPSPRPEPRRAPSERRPPAAHDGRRRHGTPDGHRREVADRRHGEAPVRRRPATVSAADRWSHAV